MKLSFYILLLMLPFTGISQSVKVVNYEQLEKYWLNSTDTLYVVNFWATWCKPCVEELPNFLKVNNENQNKPLRMILVSLDFPSDIEQRLKPFIKHNKIKPTVLVLDDNQNKWIPRVDLKWDGAIPATLFIQDKQKVFLSKTLNYNELKSQIVKFNIK